MSADVGRLARCKMAASSILTLLIASFLTSEFCLCSTGGHVHYVSFYGDGYVQVPVRRDMATVPEDADLELHFRSSRTDAIMLLIAGPTDDSDYCLVTLDRGSVVVRSYLGSGETTLRVSKSPATRRRDGDVTPVSGSATFGDLEWHFVNVTWSRGQVLLAVDRVYFDSAPIRGRHSELNVVNGYALVGIGTGTPYDATAFLYAGRDYLPYRGCMYHVHFKGYDILDMAHNPLTSSIGSSSSGVTWNQCSPEFTAQYETPITFVGNSSYALFEAQFNMTTSKTTTTMKSGRGSTNLTTTLMTFEIRTRSPDAIVIYGGAGLVSKSRHSSFQSAIVVDDENTNGNDDEHVPDPDSSSSSFLLLEILNGRLAVRMVGDRSVLLASPVVVSDGSWHRVVLASRRVSSVVSTADSVTLSVDGRTIEEPADSITLQRPLWRQFYQIFVGGVDTRSRLGLLRRRLEYLVGPADPTSVESLVGCIRNLVVHGIENGEVQQLGFPGMIASRGLRVGCLWTYPCVQPGQCPPNTECIEHEFDQFRCQCRVANCSTAADKDGLLPPVTVRGPIRLRKLVVEEGGRKLITSDHIDLIVSNRFTAGKEQPTADGINESAVLFVVRTPADNGILSVRNSVVSSFADVITFTLAELRQGHVMYIHDGSERPEDRIQLQLRMQSTGNSTEPMQRQEFTLPIQINAVNDRPTLTLPVNETLHVVAESQLTLSQQIINATDPDDQWPQLVITVDYTMNEIGGDVNAIATYGYFAMTSESGSHRGYVQVDRFTQFDINSDRVKFIHRGPVDKVQYFRLTAFDGKASSATRLLRVVGSSLELIPLKITGIAVPRFESRAINADNLKFIVSSADGILRQSDIDIRYEITERPADGDLQRQQQYLHSEQDDSGMTSPRSWNTVTLFTQRQIDQGLIRYLHVSEQSLASVQPPRADRFRFRVAVAQGVARGITALSELEFHVEVFDCRAELIRSTGLRIRGGNDGNRAVRLTSNELRAVGLLRSSSDDVTYHVISTPRQGDLLIETSSTPSGSSARRQRVMMPGANFTQRDVDLGLVYFRFHRVWFEPIIDDFEFRLIGSMTAGYRCSWQSDVALFEFRFEPVPRSIEAEQLRLVNNGLRHVLEGDKALITSDDLHVVNYASEDINGTADDYRFAIVSGPNHGRLRLYNPTTGRMIRSNVTSFANEDVRNGRVFYVHDDSETERDSFRFVVTSATSGRSDDIAVDGSGHIEQLLSGTFEIDIILRNDNPPTRIVNRVMEFIAGRGRLLTLDDLQYFDPDSNYDSSDLEYSWPTLPATPFVVLTANRSVAVERFKQLSLSDGSLYLQDRSPRSVAADRSSTHVISVTDGQFNTSDVVQFIFADAYLQVLANRSVVEVDWNSTSVLTVDSFAVDTNLDAEDADDNIRYVIVDPPQHGFIEVTGSDLTPPQFTLSDLRRDLVSYRHTGRKSTRDDFRFIVRLDNLIAAGETSISISGSTMEPDSTETDVEAVRTHPPPSVQVVSVKVEQLFSADLNAKVLEVTHPETAPSDVIYSVTAEFRQGLLIIDGRSSTPAGGESGLVTFTQSDVNGGLVHYQHRDVIIDETIVDVMKFDVLVGNVTSLRDVELVVTVVPGALPLEVRNVTVVEGSSVVIDVETLRVGISSPDVVFVVVRPPVHGRIHDANRTGRPAGNSKQMAPSVAQFPLDRLGAGAISYVHNGGDQPQDTFRVFAKRLGRAESRSRVCTVNIAVIPVNDELPRVTVNAKMNVWIGSETPIGREFLLTEDDDTEPDQLVYTLLSRPSNGDVLLMQPTRHTIDTFTQRDIDQRIVIFEHRGSSRGSFQFEVSDGVSTLLPQSFHIEASRLELRIENLVRLDAFPGVVQPITRQHLRAVVNDVYHTGPITFHIRSKPLLGQVVTSSSTTGNDSIISSFIEVMSFNQTDIDAGRVSYRHLTPSAETAWSQEDSFTFDVRTQFAEPLTSRVFVVSVSYDNINADNIDSLTNSTRSLVVDEGGSVVVNRTDLDIEPLIDRMLAISSSSVVRCFVVDIPRHGVVTVSRKTARSGTEITQDNIDAGKVVYRHDNSETVNDTFSVSVIVESSGNGADGKVNRNTTISIGVTVRPINDQSFQFGMSPYIKVIQGSRTTITRHQLLTKDSDTPPDQLVYRVTIPPTNGHLVHADLGDAADVDKFTQRDVDDEKIAFVQDGSRTSGSFYFQVSDGAHRPLSRIFGINVIPVFLNYTDQNAIVELRQGDPIVSLTDKHFAVETNNLNRSAIVYSVTKSPDVGGIFFDDEQVETWTQQDVDDERIWYIMTSPNSFDDFNVSIVDQYDNRIDNINVEIEVLVRIKLSQVPVVANGLLSITLDALDASELYEMTGIMPKYLIVNPPSLGVLKVLEPSQEGIKPEEGEGIVEGNVKEGGTEERGRRRRSSEMVERRPKKRADGDNEVLNGGDSKPPDFVESQQEFTHDDVANDRVQYVPTPVPAGSDTSPQPDNFGFLLVAGDEIPPAEGRLAFEVVPPQLPPDESAIPVREDPDDYEPEPVPPEEGGLASEHVTTALIVAGGTLTSICSIVSYRCYRLSRRRRKRRLQKHMEALADQKPPNEMIDGRDLHPSEPLLIDSRPGGEDDGGPGNNDMRRRKAEAWLSDHGIETQPRDDSRQNGDFGSDGRDRAVRPGSRWPYQPHASEAGRGADGRGPPTACRTAHDSSQHEPDAYYRNPYEGRDGHSTDPRGRMTSTTSDLDQFDDRAFEAPFYGHHVDDLRSSNSDGRFAGHDSPYELRSDTMPSWMTDPPQRQQSTSRNIAGGTVDRKPPLPPGRTLERDSSQARTKPDISRHPADHDAWNDYRANAASTPASRSRPADAFLESLFGANHRTPSANARPDVQPNYPSNILTTTPPTNSVTSSNDVNRNRNAPMSDGRSGYDDGNTTSPASSYGTPPSDVIDKSVEPNNARSALVDSQLASSNPSKTSNNQTRQPKSVHYVDECPSPYSSNCETEADDGDVLVAAVDSYNDTDNILLDNDRSPPRTPCKSLPPSSNQRRLGFRPAAVDKNASFACHDVTDDSTDGPPKLCPPDDFLNGYADDTQLDFIPWTPQTSASDDRRATDVTSRDKNGDTVDIDDSGYATGSTRSGKRQTSGGDDDDVETREANEQDAQCNRDQIVYDWQQVDPALLDLCRKTTPVLHKSQYWV